MERYWQQVAVGEIGITGQQQLAKARVLIVGAGGLGTPLAVYLAGAGVANIGISDDDSVSVSNLPRQFLYREEESGQHKTKVLSEKLRQQNPGITVQIYPGLMQPDEAKKIIEEYDLVCDCTDNIQARELIDQTCAFLGKPLIYAAVKDWEGYITVLHHKNKVSLTDIFSSQSFADNANLNCSISGIVNTTCAIAAGIQGTEVLKLILGLPTQLDGAILCFNSLGPVFRIFQLNTSDHLDQHRKY